MKMICLAASAALLAVPAMAQDAMHMSHADTAAPKRPMILDGYGNGGFPIITSNPQAQAFFNNGMQLAHAFAHKAATEAMEEAVRLDPQCAMCLWGQAWASGPTINFGKSEDEVAKLAELADKAASLANDHATDRERALIHALQLRYKKGGGGKPGDLNFAKAMAAMASQYPDDNEIAVIAADAWLMTKADSSEEWKLNARLAMPLLEGVLKRKPDDTPAIHFYIHATEIAGVPALAEPYADRLAALAPKASHLVHMPSHTYYWIGRYEDAAKTNMRAVELGIENAKRLGLGPPDGVWGLPYHSHNVTFGLGGALEAGDADIALKLGRPLVARSQAKEDAPPYAQMIAANGYYAMARFADPGEVLALPQPKLPFLQAAWHYARGEAFARRGDAANLRKEAAAIHGVKGELSKDDGSLQAQTMTYIARNVLNGRALMMEHRPAEAAVAFAEAAELQESDDFSSVADPPAWHYPVRRDLADALLKEGDLAGARKEAEAALKFRPRDPGTVALLSTLETRTAAR
jgi:tetratricopeptide (TPR) repeat protein